MKKCIVVYNHPELWHEHHSWKRDCIEQSKAALREAAQEIARSNPDPKSYMRFLREIAGYTQRALADRVGVSVPSVKRWERPDNEWPPPADVIEFLEESRRLQLEIVDYSVSLAENAPDGTTVKVRYWRTQDDYDAHHDDSQYFGCANANTRLIVHELEQMGIPYEIV